MEVRCIRCHRILKDEESKKRGMGETCAIRSGVLKVISRVMLKKAFGISVKDKPRQRFLFETDEISGRAGIE